MPLGPHREHYFQLEKVVNCVFTHVRLTIFPDGGVKRVRVFGSKVIAPEERLPIHSFESANSSDMTLGCMMVKEMYSSLRQVLALPLTPEAFAPFGQVIQPYPDTTSAPRFVKVTPANFGTAVKYHKLSLLESSYPDVLGATTGISLYRCQPAGVVKNGTKREVTLNALERHPYTNQAFLPMCQDNDCTYLVVVAKSGPDDQPNIGNLRAFIARTNQGIVYNQGVWREQRSIYIGRWALLMRCTDLPMTVFDRVGDNGSLGF
jgi:allantoicase